MLPEPFDALEASLGPDARVLPLDDRHVVRTSGRSDHVAGNAVHHPGGLHADGLHGAVTELRQRFPFGRARLVAPFDVDLAAAARSRGDLASSTLEVLLRGAPVGARPPRDDLRLSAPADDRAWHGITVLHRHAARPGEDRARGADDERLRWWVEGLQRLVAAGRARVLRAERFGTPVGVGVLHWAPSVDVGPDHAGLAVVADVVVHPAHRRLGVARTVADALVAQHLRDFPRALVAAVGEGPTPPDTGAAEDPAPPDGWRRHARLLALEPIEVRGSR